MSIGGCAMDDHEISDLHRQALQAYEAARFTCNRTDAFVQLIVAELVAANRFGFQDDLLTYRERYSP